MIINIDMNDLPEVMAGEWERDEGVQFIKSITLLSHEPEFKTQWRVNYRDEGNDSDIITTYDPYTGPTHTEEGDPLEYIDLEYYMAYQFLEICYSEDVELDNPETLDEYNFPFVNEDLYGMDIGIEFIGHCNMLLTIIRGYGKKATLDVIEAISDEYMKLRYSADYFDLINISCLMDIYLELYDNVVTLYTEKELIETGLLRVLYDIMSAPSTFGSIGGLHEDSDLDLDLDDVTPEMVSVVDKALRYRPDLSKLFYYKVIDEEDPGENWGHDGFTSWILSKHIVEMYKQYPDEFSEFGVIVADIISRELEQ